MYKYKCVFLLVHLPPFLFFQFSYLVKHLGHGSLKIVVAVITVETATHDRIFYAVRVSYIYNLEGQFESRTTFVSPKLYPYLVIWYDTVVPC